jgi:hypothetical protein
VHRAGIEPEAVVSPEQWIAIAKSISRNNIPQTEQLEICNALMEYYCRRLNDQRAAAEEGTRTLARVKVDHRAKGRMALEQFEQYVRGLRGAVTSIQQYLKQREWIDKAEQLNEDIYSFQRFARRELETKSNGGRPAQPERQDLVCRLAVIYERITGNKPGRSVDPKTGRLGGPFVRFVSAIFDAKKIPSRGLTHVIAKVARNAKNRR